jgi:AraC-like DNA-binding protein
MNEVEPAASRLAAPPGAANRVVVLAGGDQVTPELAPYLSARGFDVRVCAVDGNSRWLEDLIEIGPMAILLEPALASREGWSIAGLLKRHSATQAIPVLAYALTPEQDLGQLLELNTLQKPLRLDALTRELERFRLRADGPPTVLVVDDDPAILDLHSRLITQSGRQVRAARNGREALDLVAQQLPDLILLDLIMPELDGFGVIEALQANPTTRDIPVIVLTAHVLSEADLERCHRGVASLLGKGLFTTEETLNHIAAALQRQPALSHSTQQLIRKAMAYIHQHYAEPLTREEIAARVGISTDYLTDCFRQELGIPPITYIRRYRIRQACELLRNSDQSITQIALAVGFSDGAHFTRTFQREMKITPRAFRHNRAG